MSSVEDEIRKALRSEAERLCEVRWLRLPPEDAPDGRATAPGRTPRRRTALRAWQAPAAAAAAVLLAAATLVALKYVRNEAAAPQASSAPSANSDFSAVPRYYVQAGWLPGGSVLGVTVGDSHTGKTIATIPFAKGTTPSATPAGAADDRTFVVATGGPEPFYLLRISPGAADPARMTRLPIQFPRSAAIELIALSGDGSELAVVSGMPGTGKTALRVYSMASGRLQHAWSTSASDRFSDMSWAGDSIVGFEADITNAYQLARSHYTKYADEIRTLRINAPGTDLLADSHVVWSQEIPVAKPSRRPSMFGVHILGVCYMPFLTGNGQTVVCASSTRSGHNQRLSADWLAYPIATPTKPRVLASILMPKDVDGVTGETVEWTNVSGTELISSWSSFVITRGAGRSSDFIGLVGGGTFRPFPFLPNGEGW